MIFTFKNTYEINQKTQQLQVSYQRNQNSQLK